MWQAVFKRSFFQVDTHICRFSCSTNHWLLFWKRPVVTSLWAGDISMLLQIAFCLADVVARKVALLRDPFGPVIVGPDLNVQAHVFALHGCCLVVCPVLVGQGCVPSRPHPFKLFPSLCQAATWPEVAHCFVIGFFNANHTLDDKVLYVLLVKCDESCIGAQDVLALNFSYGPRFLSFAEVELGVLSWESPLTRIVLTRLRPCLAVVIWHGKD